MFLLLSVALRDNSSSQNNKDNHPFRDCADGEEERRREPQGLGEGGGGEDWDRSVGRRLASSGGGIASSDNGLGLAANVSCTLWAVTKKSKKKEI